MKEIQDKIAEHLAQMAASGDIDNMIREKLAKMVDGIINDLLGPWSPLTKTVKAQIESQLNVNLDLGLGGYNELVATIVSQRLDAAIQGTWKASLEESLDKMLRAAPASIKLSDLLERLADDHERDAHAGGWEHATMLVEQSQYGSTWVYLDPQPRGEHEKYKFLWSLMISKDGELWSASESVRGVEIGTSSSARTRRRDLFDRKVGMEAFLFQLHAGKSKIEIDREPGLHEHEYPEAECSC